MIGIIMAGGKGSRMNLSSEKLLLRYKKPIILHVADALKDSDCFFKILAITSPNSPQTKKLLEENNIETLDTPGISYAFDLNLALRSICDYVLVVSGDLPLLDREVIRMITEQYDPQKIWTSILVTGKFLDMLGLESDYSVHFAGEKCHYTGISLINSKKITGLENLVESYAVLDDRRVAFNLNSKQDYDLLCSS